MISYTEPDGEWGQISKIPAAVRFVSCEPLLEDIADEINLDGFRWLIVGGESGDGPEYLWDGSKDWRKEFSTSGRRTIRIEWARRLLKKSREAGIPYFFKQVTAFRSGMGEDALGQVYHEFPPAPHVKWADKTLVEQPPLVTIFGPALTTPPASLLAQVAPASAEEKIPSKTPPDSSNATNVAFEIAQLGDDQLDNRIEEKATEIVGQFTNRLADELFPLLYLKRSRLPHGEWTKWFAAFCERHPIKLTLRTVQRKFAELEAGWGVKITSRGPAHKKASPAVTQAANLLSDAKAALGKAAEGGSEQAKATIAQYEKEFAAAVAQADEVSPAIVFPIISSAMDCNGCRDMHEGIIQLAKAHPDWSEEQLVEATGCGVTIIRQAFTRFLVWRATA